MLNDQIQSALQWRYATKRFDANKKIADKDWATLESALVNSPSSYGLQPYRFLVVKNADVRAKLREASWGQSQVTDASHYVVLAAKEKVDAAHIDAYLKRIVEVRGVTLESLAGYRAMMIQNLVDSPRAANLEPWAQRQAYIAMGFLLETAALLKIDACPMEGLDPGAYDKILGLEGTGWKSVATVALGYRHAEDGLQGAKKVRFSNEALVQVIK